MQVSFEFYPPKTSQALDKLVQTAQTLKRYSPEYFSVTYGAGGSTQNRTAETVTRLIQTTGCETAPHISCIGTDVQTLEKMLREYQELNIRRLVVLRGDRPSGMPDLHSDFNYASELVKFIRDKTADFFHIEVAVYPEFHPETPNASRHIMHFKQKVEAGANSAITQYFYNADAYFYLLEDCEKYGINIPIVPGIMPITNVEQLTRFSNMCGAEIPKWLRVRLASYENDKRAIQEIGADFVCRLCERLIAGGAPALHFYTLNLTKPTQTILDCIMQESRSAINVR